MSKSVAKLFGMSGWNNRDVWEIWSLGNQLRRQLRFESNDLMLFQKYLYKKIITIKTFLAAIVPVPQQHYLTVTPTLCGPTTNLKPLRSATGEPPPPWCCQRPARVLGRLIQNKFSSEENVYLLRYTPMRFFTWGISIILSQLRNKPSLTILTASQQSTLTYYTHTAGLEHDRRYRTDPDARMSMPDCPS